MGAPVLERRVRMTTSRSDAIALLGMAKNMFDTVHAIQEAENYPQLVVALFELGEQELNKEDLNWEAQRDLQLRVRTFIQVHKIKKEV